MYAVMESKRSFRKAKCVTRLTEWVKNSYSDGFETLNSERIRRNNDAFVTGGIFALHNLKRWVSHTLSMHPFEHRQKLVAPEYR